MPGIFDKKIFNTEVFNKYTERVPNLRKNELLKSRALVARNDLKAAKFYGYPHRQSAQHF